MACSGCGGPCPPCPQSVYVHTLDPDCPVPVAAAAGFVDILTKVVPVPAGLPSFGIAVVADLLIANGAGVSAVEYRIVDVGPDGSTTVLRTKTIAIPATADEDLAIIGALNNLSAGNHTIKLQVDSSAALEVASAGMKIDLLQMVTFVVDDECVAEAG